MEEPVLLLLVHAVQLAQFQGSLTGSPVHIVYEVISIYYGSLTGLHLALRKFNHAVRKMVNGIAPVKAQFLENKLEHLEMIVLLVAHHIYFLIQLVFLETLFCSSKVLGHVD